MIYLECVKTKKVTVELLTKDNFTYFQELKLKVKQYGSVSLSNINNFTSIENGGGQTRVLNCSLWEPSQNSTIRYHSKIKKSIFQECILSIAGLHQVSQQMDNTVFIIQY